MSFIHICSEFFCRLAECEKHHSPLTRNLPDDCLTLWILIRDKFQSKLAALKTLAILIEHTAPQTVVIALQLTRRQHVMEEVWSDVRSSNRRVRVIAG